MHGEFRADQAARPLRRKRPAEFRRRDDFRQIAFVENIVDEAEQLEMRPGQANAHIRGGEGLPLGAAVIAIGAENRGDVLPLHGVEPGRPGEIRVPTAEQGVLIGELVMRGRSTRSILESTRSRPCLVEKNSLNCMPWTWV